LGSGVAIKGFFVGIGVVGATVGDGVGCPVGAGVGEGVGCPVGAGVGDGVGCPVGAGVGDGVGCPVGAGDGAPVGALFGAKLGAAVGLTVGSNVGSIDGSAVGLVLGAVVIADGAGVGIVGDPVGFTVVHIVPQFASAPLFHSQPLYSTSRHVALSSVLHRELVPKQHPSSLSPRSREWEPDPLDPDPLDPDPLELDPLRLLSLL